MKTLILAIAVIALGARDEGVGIDPHGRPATVTRDVGCGIDPNGCSGYAGTVDPNGRPSI